MGVKKKVLYIQTPKKLCNCLFWYFQKSNVARCAKDIPSSLFLAAVSQTPSPWTLTTWQGAARKGKQLRKKTQWLMISEVVLEVANIALLNIWLSWTLWKLFLWCLFFWFCHTVDPAIQLKTELALLDTLDIYVPFLYLGPLGIFWITWIYRYLLDTLDI